MDKVEYLVDLHRTIKECWEELEVAAPELASRLRDCLSSVAKAESEAKRDLRDMGPGRHVISGREFVVNNVSPKVKFDVEDVVIEAEDCGHLDVLMSAGFVTYAVDAKQLQRLPPEIKVRYQSLGTESPSTPRVRFPKNL